MTERTTDTRMDREIRAFLIWQAEDLAGAPSATEMAVRVGERVRPGSLLMVGGYQQRLVLAVLLAALLTILIVAVAFVGGNLPQPLGVQNGWIAFSTQPGYKQTAGTDYAEGGDIYLVREGVDPRIIVERGPDMKRNVCPDFSPDGSRLVYGELAGSSAALVVLDLAEDGSVSEKQRIALSGSSSVAPCPRWSEHGTHLAYLDHVQESVVVVDLAGRAVVATPQDPGVDDFSRRDPMRDDEEELWSPNGELRAVCAGDVVVGPPDGSADRTIAGCGYSIAEWSPDGTRLLVMDDVSGRHFTMRAAFVTGGGDPMLVPEQIASFIPVNGGRSWPGRGDVSWQPVYP